MAFWRKEVQCRECGYQGYAAMGWLGITLWVMTALFVFFSFVFWPLFLLWPILFYLLLLLPFGQVCPACRSGSVRLSKGGAEHKPGAGR